MEKVKWRNISNYSRGVGSRLNSNRAFPPLKTIVGGEEAHAAYTRAVDKFFALVDVGVDPLVQGALFCVPSCGRFGAGYGSRGGFLDFSDGHVKHDDVLGWERTARTTKTRLSDVMTTSGPCCGLGFRTVVNLAGNLFGFALGDSRGNDSILEFSTIDDF
eukprot:scaffold68857_cov39-Attheya_sp.AAC.1